MVKFLKWEIHSFWLKFFYVLFLVVLVFPYYRIYENPEGGIDNSWRIALELAKAKGLIFGKDIIYTYGPLGSLTQRFAITSSPFQFFVFDLFFFINVGILFFLLLPKPLKLYQLFIHFLVFFFVSSMYGEWVHFLLFYSSIFLGIRFLQVKNHWLLAYSILVGIITFFVKANYGIIGLGFVAMLTIYSFFTKRLTLTEFLLYIISSAVISWLLALILKTDLLQYFYSSIKVIGGYNEAQSLFPESRLRLVIVAYLIWGLLVSLGGVYAIRNLIQNRKLSLPLFDNLFIWSSSIVIAFILIKYAFVRADDGHITAFVKLANLPLLLLPFFATNQLFKIGGWVLITLNIVSYLVFYQPMFGKVTFSIPDNLRTKTYIFPEYVQDIFSKPAYKPKTSYPADVLSTIGNKSVDIIPNEVSEIYFNRLNYNPRPTLQSYQAYNKYLDEKNREKYLSPTAPDYVVYGVESTDNKYAWGDETQTLLALLQRYKPVKIWNNRLLLEKQPVTKTLKPIKTETVKLRFGQDYNIPVDTSVNTIRVLKIKTSGTWFGKLLNLFFQPSHFALTITTKDGKKASYNSVSILLEKGLIINSRIDNVQDVKQFFESASVQNKTVKSINIQEIVRGRAGFKVEFELEQVSYEMQ
jgi:ABC-type cobalamin transport system permease subunit